MKFEKMAENFHSYSTQKGVERQSSLSSTFLCFNPILFSLNKMWTSVPLNSGYLSFTGSLRKNLSMEKWWTRIVRLWRKKPSNELFKIWSTDEQSLFKSVAPRFPFASWQGHGKISPASPGLRLRDLAALARLKPKWNLQHLTKSLLAKDCQMRS